MAKRIRTVTPALGICSLVLLPAILAVVLTISSCRIPGTDTYPIEWTRPTVTEAQPESETQAQTSESPSQAVGTDGNTEPSQTDTEGQPDPVVPTECTHSYGEWTVEKQPNCTEEGLRRRYCLLCGASESEPIATVDHSPVQDEAVAPTCTENGLTAGSHCAVCGLVLKEQVPVPAVGHTEKKGEAIPPTCTEGGMTAEVICTVCGAVLEESQAVPPTGHTPVSIPYMEATCTEDGHMAGTRCAIWFSAAVKPFHPPVTHR